MLRDSITATFATDSASKSLSPEIYLILGWRQHQGQYDEALKRFRKRYTWMLPAGWQLLFGRDPLWRQDENGAASAMKRRLGFG